MQHWLVLALMLSCVKHLRVGLPLGFSRTLSEKFAVTYFATVNHTKSMPDMEKWAKAMLLIARNEQNVSENNVGLICDFLCILQDVLECCNSIFGFITIIKK